MGCFLACFGGAKDRKQRRRSKKSLPKSNNNRVNRNYQPLQTSPSPQKPIIVKQEPDVAEIFQTPQTSASPQKPIIEEVDATADVAVPELRETEEQPGSVSCRKKVTFDLNVKTYENVVVGEDIKDPLEDEEGKGEAKDKSKGKVSPDPNYRYQNCESSDDEGIEDDDDEGEFDDSDFDDEDEDEDDEVAVVGAEEESYDSFFSLPMDKERWQQNSEEVNSPVPTSNVPANGGARDRSQYVHSVLNPVENLSQWKEVKVRALPLKNPNKENNNAELGSKTKGSNKENSGSKLEAKVTGFSPEPTFKTNKPQKPIDSASTPNHSTKQEISVDASLSTWLVSSENSPKRSNSRWSNTSVSREEQPILGALTVEDLKQLSSVTSSPRRSPSRNPDEIPILGTVGSYWNSRTQYSETKGIPNTTSKYREDKSVNWHSTPLEV